MISSVFVVESEPINTEGSRVSDWVAALGIDCHTCTPMQMLSGNLEHRGPKPCLLVSWSALAQLAASAAGRRYSLDRVLQSFDKVCVHTFDPAVVTPELLLQLTGSARARIVPCPTDASKYSVSASHRQITGPFSGLESTPIQPHVDFTLVLEASNRIVDSLISIEGKGLLTRISGGPTELFLISSSRVLDINLPSSVNIDVRGDFSSLVPILLFLRYACADSGWQPTANFANLIVDDALLQPRYGFLKLRELARAVQDLGAAATVAFIPWNYRRSDRDILSLFARGFPALAICAHGCSHTGAEFGIPDASHLAQLSVLARSRMEAHQQITGLGFERVMVFPQGVFSKEALKGLEAAGFLAAINTEIARGEVIRLKDLLQPAVTSYGGVPLFVRRRAEDDLVNFAFDLLVGKPCLIVTHHDFFRNGMQPMRDLVFRLNGLGGRLRWTNLETLVRQSVALKKGADGRKTIRVYCDAPIVESIAEDQEEVQLAREEIDAESIQSVTVGGRSVAFSVANRTLSFAARLDPRSPTAVQIHRNPWPLSPNNFTERERASRIAARRYLSEFRDNYLSRSEMALKLVHRVRQFAKSSIKTSR
jgi:hypothetical protein